MTLAKTPIVLFVASISAFVTVVHLHQYIIGIRQTKMHPSSTQEPTSTSCLRAMDHGIPQSRHGHMPKPFINLGMPKMGSTSLKAFFTCGGYNSSHYECGKEFCANCIKRAVSVNNSKSPLSSCGQYDAYVQLDDGSFFPQIEYLNEIHDEYPNATFLLTFRGMEGWYRSISHWPPRADVTNPPLVMSNRMKRSNITGFPTGAGNDSSEFSTWFCNHVTNVRNFIKRHSSHALIEIDIEGDGNGEMLGELFGIQTSCWGHANKNPGLGGKKMTNVPV